jgi:hypothetical protein
LTARTHGRQAAGRLRRAVEWWEWLCEEWAPWLKWKLWDVLFYVCVVLVIRRCVRVGLCVCLSETPANHWRLVMTQGG